MKRANTIAAVLFLLFLFTMLGQSVMGGQSILRSVRTDWQNRADKSEVSLLAKAEFVTDHTEGALNRVLDYFHVFIETYGTVQRLTGQRLVEETAGNDVVKLDNGTLIFGGINNPYIDTADNARSVANFASKLDMPLLTVVAPDKVPPDTVPMPEVLRSYHNDMANRYLSVLQEEGVSTLDLRENFKEAPDWASLFFRTDHHWRPEGAFFGYQALMERLSADYGFPVNEEALSEDSFEKTVYEDFFLGSQGKRTGAAYAGVDDFTVYTPKFETSFRYHIYDRDLERTGTFNEALCFPERIEHRDFYTTNPYTYYSGGDWGRSAMVNELNPDGPKIVMLRDSYACALAPFLALQCSELTTLDMRHFEGDYYETIEEIDPDLVIVMYTASTSRLPNMFAFEK